MFRLMLLRHAKSDWPDGVADHERPLGRRGTEAAPAMGAYMATEQLIPDLVVVSSARRTRETWELAGAAFREELPTRFEPRIYDASPEDLLGVVHETPNDVRTLLLVGHNPGFEELAGRLVGHGDRYAFARMLQKFPTAALAVIDFTVAGWADVVDRAGRLDRFVTPRMIGGIDE
jgi:phosphohistidine phosphatase